MVTVFFFSFLMTHDSSEPFLSSAMPSWPAWFPSDIMAKIQTLVRHVHYWAPVYVYGRFCEGRELGALWFTTPSRMLYNSVWVTYLSTALFKANMAIGANIKRYAICQHADGAGMYIVKFSSIRYVAGNMGNALSKVTDCECVCAHKRYCAKKSNWFTEVGQSRFVESHHGKALE